MSEPLILSTSEKKIRWVAIITGFLAVSLFSRFSLFFFPFMGNLYFSYFGPLYSIGGALIFLIISYGIWRFKKSALILGFTTYALLAATIIYGLMRILIDPVEREYIIFALIALFIPLALFIFCSLILWKFIKAKPTTKL